MKRHQSGFAVVELIIAVVIVVVLALAGYKILAERSKATELKKPVKWAYNEQARNWYVQSGKAPACREPFTFDVTPIDLSLANVIGPPGAYRGGNYKAHGGIRIDGVPGGKVDVKLPINAKLVSLTRYYEGSPSTLQYVLSFETDCGIAFRFDHLAKLTPKFQEFANKTPQPKKDDTRSNPGDQPAPVAFTAGEVIATEVGFPATNNFGFDFGVYDYRQRNEISSNQKWAELHKQYSSLDYHGVCWLNMFPGTDAAKATQLSEVVLNPAKPTIVSDYCPNIKLKTLDINNGLPTDG